MNFLMPLFTSLAIRIHGSEQHGRRAKDWRSSSRIAELCLFWTAWSRSKIHLVHKKGGYGTRPFRHYCESLLLGFAGSDKNWVGLERKTRVACLTLHAH
jgi:hypothetical protein